MKRLIMFALMLQVILICFAGAVSALDLQANKDTLTAEQTSFTFGLGWAGNEFLGGVTRDGLGYPKNSSGLNNWLGYSYTWIYGAPSKQEILDAIDKVVAENGGADKLRDYDLKLLTKQKLNIGSYTYFRLGTVYILLPLIAQYGWMMPLSDTGMFQVGLGLPLVLNLGMNFYF